MTRSYPPVSVFGAPTDIGASRRGASMGPEALRVAGLVEALAARGVDVRDVGDVQGPRNPMAPPQGGYRHLEEVAAWNRAVFDCATRELQAGRLHGNRLPYQLMNLLGAAGVLASLWGSFNISVFLLEATWAAISLYGIARTLGGRPARGA